MGEEERQGADTRLVEPTEEERRSYDPLEKLPPDLRLLRKLDAWLRMQPEWVVFLAPDRQQRRDIARRIAKAITTIPK